MAGQGREGWASGWGVLGRERERERERERKNAAETRQRQPRSGNKLDSGN